MENLNELKLPERVPLMIFSTALIFPNTVQPLRIFESRYRAMLEWALERDRMFCLTQLQPGAEDSFEEDDFYHTAGLGLIRACMRLPDETSQLLLHGMARVQLSDLEMEGPFWTAKITVMRDHGHTDADNASLMDEVRTLVLTSASQAGEVPEEFTEQLELIRDPGVLCDSIGNALVTDPLLRQELLEEEDVTDRLRKLRKMLKADLAL